MEKERVCAIVATILQQLKGTTPMPVLWSWGFNDPVATSIVADVNGYQLEMGALVFKVNGLRFSGKIIVALDEGADYYRIYGVRNGEGTMELLTKDICFDEMGSVLDRIIETDNDQSDEYKQQVDNEPMSDILGRVKTVVLV